MAGLTPITGVCTADCDTPLVFEAIEADQNCAPQTFLSEFGDLVIRPTGAPAPFTSWTGSGATVTLTADAIDNTAGDNSKCIHLVGIGSMDAPEKTTQVLPKFQTKTTKRKFNPTFRILNLSDAMYELLRQLQCAPSNFTFYYGNESHMFGVTDGLIPTFVDVDFIYAEGEESIESATLYLQFQAIIDPERVNNPLS